MRIIIRDGEVGGGGHGISPDFCLFADCANEIRRELDGEGRREGEIPR